MIETILSITSSAVSIYGLIHAVKAGHQQQESLSQLELLNATIEKIDKRILTIEAVVVQDVTRSKQQVVRDNQKFKKKLLPIQEQLKSDILSSAAIETPDKLHQLMRKSPNEALLDIKPISEGIHHGNPDMVPILFEANSSYYIGWQNREVIPQVFDCKYNPSYWIPERERNNIFKIVEQLSRLEHYHFHVRRRPTFNISNMRYRWIEEKRQKESINNIKRDIENKKFELSGYIGENKANRVSELMYQKAFLQKHYDFKKNSYVDEALDHIISQFK